MGGRGEFEPQTVGLDDVIITGELAHRPSRPPDHAAENRALAALARAMAASPETVLGQLANAALELCRADSAGISILEPGDAHGVFRWRAIAGDFAGNLGGTMPGEASPCGTVIRRDAVLLFDRAERHFPALRGVEPRMHESLLAPFHAGEMPVGTVWVVSHAPGPRFDAEDARLLVSLSRFASAAYQTTAALRAESEARDRLEQRVGERTAEAAAARAFAESLVDTVRDPLLVLDGELRVVSASREFYRTFRVEPAETEGRLVYDLGNRQWDIPRLRTLLGEVLPEDTTFRAFEVEHHFEHIGRKVMRLNARRLRRGPGQREMMLLAIEDVTARLDAEEARREAETRFTEMVKNVRDHSIFLTDPAGVVTSWNVAAERIIGYPEAEAVGQHFSLIFTPEDVQAGLPEQELRQAREWGRAEDERWHRRKDGERFWALGIVTPLRDAAGKLTGYSKILRDMSERRRAEEALRDAAGQRRLALDAAGMGTFVWYPGEDRSESDEPLHALFGPAPDALFKPAVLSTSIHPADRERYAAAVARALDPAGSGELSEEVRVSRPDEEERWLAVTARAEFAGGVAVRMPGVVADVTARRRAEEALRASERRLKLALTAARMGIWALDLATGTQMRDANLNGLLGLHPADTTQPFAEFLTHIHPDDRETVVAAFDASARVGRPLGVEFRVVRPDGAVRWLRDQGDVFEGAAAGRHMAGACVDVTERREAEDALRASEERLRLIVESATDYAIFTLDPDRTVTSWSPGAESIFGYDDGEVLGRSGDILYTPEDRAAGVPQEEARTAIREGRAADERWHVSRNGTRFFASGVMTPLGAGGARGFVKVASDLTERKRMEDALARDARILASVHDAVVVTDLGGVVTYWNEGAARLFGWPAAEVVGRHYAERFPEPERAWVAAEIAKRAGGLEWVGEHEDLCQDGSRVWIDARVARFDGPDGRPAGILGVSRDITGRKRAEAELQRARDELEDRVAERTAELARANAALREAMAARTELLRRLVTAQEDERRRLSRELHDGLGQELTALILGLKALEQVTPVEAPGRARLLEVERIVAGIGREAHDLAVELRPTALDDLGLASALSAYMARWSERTGIAADFQPVGLDGDRLPPEVETAVYRVVQEALNNAVKHAEARRVSVMVARRDGELVTLVEDDGRGFDPERAGRGPGGRSLGLLGMRERVGLVGGTLVIESGDGEGTVVQARIPLARQSGEAGLGG